MSPMILINTKLYEDILYTLQAVPLFNYGGYKIQEHTLRNSFMNFNISGVTSCQCNV